MFRQLLITVVAATVAITAPSLASDDVPTRAEDVQPIEVGAAAPGFVARNADGSEFEFDPAQQDRTLLIFYRGGWCPYCNRHLMSLQNVVPKLKESGVDVLFLSADSPERLYSSLEDETLDYTLLSDASMSASRAFGVAFQVDDETVERYKGFGIDLEEASGFDHHILPVPAVYLIEDGKVAFMHADSDYKKRLEGDKILSAAGLSGD
ncbi:MAG: peroxiredoxin-like family protein [Pseudomonadota bacterium]